MCIALNEGTATLNVFTHRSREQGICSSRIINSHLQQDASLRIHGGLPQLFSIHLAKTLVALDVFLTKFLAAGKTFFDKCIALAI